MDVQEKLKFFNLRLKSLKSEYDTGWRDHFIDIAEHVTSRRGRFLESDTQPNKGDRRTKKIINNTAERCVSTLTAGMYYGLTPSSKPWIGLTLEDEDLIKYQPVKDWLSRVRDIILNVLHLSNFYTVIPTIYEEMGVFGTGSMLIEEDPRTVIRFYPFTMGEYFIATDHHLRVDSLYRIFWMTVGNMIQMFGEDQVNSKIKNAYKNGKTEDWHQIVHLIEPNDDRIDGRENSANKPWRSVYYDYKTTDDKLLRESGYDEFPITAPRWSVTGSEIWGRGPGMKTLPDVKMLQKMESKGLRALDKMVDPPLSAPIDAQERGVSMIPGTVNYTNVNTGQQGITPLYTVKPDFQSMEYKIKEVENKIKEGFYYDLFKMVSLSGDSPQKTAYEIAKRHEEKLQLLSPMVERVQPEMLHPTVDRVYAVSEKRGRLPRPPRELEGMPLKVEYNSILAQAQKLVGTTGIEQGANFVGSLAAIKEDVIDKMDFDEAVTKYFDMLSVPPSILRADDAVEKIRKDRQEKIEQAESAAMAQGTIDGARAMSEINTGENNALTQLLGGSST